MSHIAVMNRRSSVRTYSEELLDNDILEKTNKVISKERKGPFGNVFSFTLIDTKSEHAQEIGKMTSYGFIKGARY